MQKKAALPSVLDYLDYRRYLHDSYECKKAADPRFSCTVWAEEAGFKSRSFLRLVIQGKRSLSAESIRQVAASLALTQKATQYFTNLVHYNQAADHASREYYLNELFKVAPKSQVQAQIKDTYRFFINPVSPRVLAYLTLEDVDRKPQTIAAVFKLTLAQTEEILETFSHLGLAVRDPERGEWRSLQKEFSIPSDLGNLALQSFTKRSLTEAIEAIDRPVHERSFSSLILTLTDDELKDVARKIESFWDQLLFQYNKQKGDHRRIYQINVQTIPVSEKLIRAPKALAPERSPTHIANEAIV